MHASLEYNLRKQSPVVVTSKHYCPFLLVWSGRSHGCDAISFVKSENQHCTMHLPPPTDDKKTGHQLHQNLSASQDHPSSYSHPKQVLGLVWSPLHAALFSDKNAMCGVLFPRTSRPVMA
ncbi:hypothetical protein B296_00005805 [Ensete ventricosum]|uniref:Uncharacterized protein n=1 Tax=Ensete ventricosum TaxID=4639 RepID=A0A427BBX6_ENSVE|nr:hypothetical protein B296_00005805 [Ensete ventricosum]